MNPNHPLARQLAAINRQLQHMTRVLPPTVRDDYWYTELFDRLQTSRSILLIALAAHKYRCQAADVQARNARRSATRALARWRNSEAERYAKARRSSR